MFSLDQLVAPPPVSLVISLLLIGGIDLIGILFLRLLGLVNCDRKDWVRWQAPIVGAMLLAIALYPLVLAGLTSRRFIQLIASALVGAGIVQLFRTVNWIYSKEETLSDYWKVVAAQTHSKKLLIFLLLGMGLLALGPVTNADALDYHMGVAIAILNNGGMPVAPEWFIGRLAGNGEVLNALAISLGAEQFGSLLQYVSLLGIVGIILFAGNSREECVDRHQAAVSDVIALAAFSVPILLFLISAPKPQMWPIAMTTFAFALVVHPFLRGSSRQGSLAGFALVCALVMTASQAKFNYLLGGGVVGLFALLAMAKQRLFWASMGIGLIAAVLVIAPPVLWKAAVFNGGWIDALIHPLPGRLPGTDAFIALAKSASDMASPLPFPFLMLIPTSIGSFSTLLGMGWLVLIGLRPGRDQWLWGGIAAASFMIIASVLLAPPSSRMYLEPYYWLMIVLVLQPTRSALASCSPLRWVVLGQALVVASMCWLGALSLLPGALTATWRTDVMQRSANGYEIMKWADTVLPKNAVVLNGHRSMALMPRDAVAYDWSNFVELPADQSSIYLNRLKIRSVSHILVIGPINRNLPISNCFGRVIGGPGVGHSATRNPFNQGPNYEAWIVEFDSQRLPECAQHVFK
jgi:hypothetical protein